MFIFGDNMLIGYKMETKYSHTFLCGGVGLSSAKLAHQRSKPVMLSSQVKIAGNVCNRLYGTYMSFLNIIQCNSFYAYLRDKIFRNSTTQLPLR